MSSIGSGCKTQNMVTLLYSLLKLEFSHNFVTLSLPEILNSQQ